MNKLSLVIVLALSVAGCSRSDALEIPAGSDVTIQKNDGVRVTGTLLEVQSERVVLRSPAGEKTEVRRSEIATIAAIPKPAETPSATSAAAPAEGAPGAAADRVATTPPSAPADETSRTPLSEALERGPAFREVTIPAGTLLPVELQSAVASDTSNPEDQVRGTLRRAVSVDGVQALPAGTVVLGHVTSATRSARVKGRASIAFRFNQIDLPGAGGRMSMTTGTISRMAPATKKQDAAKIGGGAAGGAIIGGILGGGDGAAKGAAIGGAAGTGVVLSTRGKEVRLGPGAALSVRLTAPLAVRVPVKR